jgi:hypothetical protein
MIEFQELLESMAREGLCDAPFALVRRPYGALATEVDKPGQRLLLMGALMMQEVLTGATRATFDQDDLIELLETTREERIGDTLVVSWPELKFIPF